MVFAIPELDAFFLLNSPEYRKGYQAGFDACKEEMLSLLKAATKEVKNTEAYKESSSTFQTAFRVKKESS